MNLGIPFNNPFILALLSVILGGVITLVTQRILKKRSLLTYFVQHSRVGVSADDSIFGIVRVTWNDNVVANLYSSTLELRNESLKDFDNIIARVFTNNTILLTERTEILGTTRSLKWTTDFPNSSKYKPEASRLRLNAIFMNGGVST